MFSHQVTRRVGPTNKFNGLAESFASSDDDICTGVAIRFINKRPMHYSAVLPRRALYAARRPRAAGLRGHDRAHSKGVWC